MRVRTMTWSRGVGWTQAPLPSAAPGPSTGGTLVLAFADRWVEDLGADGPLGEIVAAFPDAVVTGCSTAGQVLQDHVADADLVLAVMDFEGTRPSLAWVRTDEAPGSVTLGGLLGQRIAASAAGAGDLAVLLLSDGLQVNGSELVSGLTAALPPGTGISGGLAADGDRFERTWVLVDGVPRSGVVAAVALPSARMAVGYGVAGGWDGFGPRRRVTSSTGNVLHELDGRPALSLYREYLGDRVAELPASALLFPLSVCCPDGGADLVRTVQAVDEASQSMTFAGDVPQGWTARLMRTTHDRLVDGANQAAQAAVDQVPHPDVAIAVSCVGRRLVLGQECDEEIEAVREALGASPALVGFYSYGEISTHLGGCALHNQTMTLTTLAGP